MNKFQKFFVATTLGLSCAVVSSCSKSDDVVPPGPEKPEATQYFSLSIKSGSASDASYILTTDSLLSGQISTSGKGLEHIGRGYFIPAGNFLYDINESENKIMQFEMLPDGTVVKKAEILAAKYLADGGQSRNVIDNDKYLFFIDPIVWGKPEVKWLRIKLPEFVVDGHGTVTLPLYKNDPAYWVNPGNTVVHGNKLIMGSVNYKNDPFEYAPGSQAVVFDWPSMTNPKVIHSDKTGQLGNIALSNYANDDKGNLYIAVGCDDKGQWDKPSVDKKQYGGLLRIKAGESDFDPDYFLDFTKEMGGVPTNIFNIFTAKNNKAVAYIYNCENVGWKQVGGVDHGYYVTIDFGTGKIVKHTMPLSASVSSREALIYNDKFYSFHKVVATNKTNVIEVDFNGGADAWKLGASIEGENITSYGIAAHPLATTK